MRVERFNYGDVHAVQQEKFQILHDDSTDSLERPRRKSSVAESGALRLFVLQQNEWLEYTPDISKGIFTIGSDESDSIVISNEPGIQKNHILAKYAGKNWFIIERAEKSILLVNNMKKRQVILKEQSSCVLKVGSFTILMTSNSPEGREKLTQSGKTFKITTDDSVYRFNTGKTVLVGSSPLCDINVNGRAFEGLITISGGVYFFYSIIESCFISGENKSLVPMALPEQSSIKMSSSSIQIEFSQGQQPLHYLYQVHTTSNPPFFILSEITDSGVLGTKTSLPPNGHSVSAGRGRDSYMIIDSSKISRHHAQIITSSNNIILTDSESTNGTFVNDKKITRKIVFPGDIISFAGSNFILHYNEQQ